MAENKNQNSEFEVKLVVASRQSREIASSLKKLTRVGDYRLGNRQVIKIRDIYFDTGIDTLRKNQLALRARLTENKKLLTLKGRAAIADWGGIKRLEIEETWSVSSLQKILERIPDLNFDPNFLFAIFLPDNPVKTLEKLDFRIVQDRITQREMRDVVIQGSHESLADFVIDEVHFQTTAGEVIHQEVEIEAPEEKSIEYVHIILKELQNRYPEDLRIWLYSKLETGDIIAQKIKKFDTINCIDNHRHLLQEGYSLLESYLSS